MNPQRWYVIVNPVAGKRRGLLDWPLISKLLRDSNIEYDAVFTEKKYHAVELTVEAVNKSYRKIIVVGGDGTLHEVVNGLFIQRAIDIIDVTIAIIPVGSGNDLIRMYGIPNKYTDCIAAIKKGNTVIQDVGELSYYESKVNHIRHMVNVAGFGLDGYVNKRYNEQKEKGKVTGSLTYIVTMLLSLLTYRSIKMKIWVDGKKVIDGKVLTGVIGIGKFNGGGMLQAPNAIADDGLFDVTVVREGNALTVLRNYSLLFNGNIYAAPRAQFFRGRHVVVEYDGGYMEVDGELLGESPYEFNIIERKVRLVAGVTYTV